MLAKKKKEVNCGTCRTCDGLERRALCIGTIKDLRCSATKCETCRIVFSATRWARERLISAFKTQTGTANDTNITLSGLSWIKKQIDRDTEDQIWFSMGYLGSPIRNNQGPLSIHLDIPKLSASLWCNVYTPPDVQSLWPKIGTARDLKDSLNVNDSATWIRQWMTECRTQHKRCIQYKSVLPTRVVDVRLSDSDTIHLYEAPPSEYAPYIALSYCWGSQGNLRTTVNNLQAHKDSIPWHAIPATIQDAIHLARQLDIRYIWIDALCIVQDDPNDWNVEALKMAEYYRGAYLVVGATRSASATQGIFGPRMPVDDGPTDFATTRVEISTENQQVTLHSREIPGHHKHLSPTVPGSKSNPLLFRAWVFQEHLLALRAVHFTAEEIAWDCREAAWCECGNTWWNTDLSDFDNVLRRCPYPKPDRFWRNLVIQYSQKSITFFIDKLIAFEGIARQFRDLGLGHYYYGIWEASLLEDLGWNACLTGHPTCSLTDANADVIIGPSWSWLATNFQIEDVHDWLAGAPDVEMQHLPKIHRLPKVSPTLDLRKAISYPPPSWDIWSLTLDTKVVEAHVRRLATKSHPYSIILSSNDNVQPRLEGCFYPDIDLDDSGPCRNSAMARWKWVDEQVIVKCVLLYTAEPHYWKAIVVKQSQDNPNLHIRVGLASHEEPHQELTIWYTTENSTITII